MKKILSIGNSFSQDAQRYLQKVALNEGEEFKCVNLYIGGCSLGQHFVNMTEDKANYAYELNGEDIGNMVSIKQALTSDEWDYVTLQQVSQNAPFFDTYVPFLEHLADYVRLYSSKSKILMHQTWAYEMGSERLREVGFIDPHDMLERIRDSYEKAAKLICADGIIPSGEMMMGALDAGIKRIHRDTFHADLGIGRYLLALTWFHTLAGRKASCDYDNFDVEVSNEDVKIIKEL